jgi:DMSO/TMAO reductase YedYZ molybdopterin-dependent catalytic subunit
MNKNKGLHDIYADDPEKADELVWGRKSDKLSRRGFVKGSGLAAMTAVLGASIPFAKYMPGGLIPAALAQTGESFVIPGKSGLTILNDRPINAETPAHLLDDLVTPASRLFVRNNGIPPSTWDVDPLQWQIHVEGEACERPQVFTLGDIQQKFKHHTLQLQIECGGNGRSEFQPPANGNQWTTGAIGCPTWTGVRLKDLLLECGVAENAIYVAYEGADSHLSGDPTKQAISRGVPMDKALENESMIVWEMNGEPLPDLHGFPVRMMCAGWPASVSGKWLTRILVRDRIHDGAKMTGQSYRVPCKPVPPGTAVEDEDMCIIESMPVKSLITFPKSGIELGVKKRLGLRGHAWAGDSRVKKVETSIDFGASWQKAKLKKPANRLAWQHWAADVEFLEPGYYEVWARATDDADRSQPMVLPGWNPRGYLNNACHRIAVMVSV